MAVEKISIIKPLVKMKPLSIGNTLYDIVVETSGRLEMTLASKEKCIEWVNKVVKTIEHETKTTFSAECVENQDHFDSSKDGSYRGKIQYL